MHSIKKLLCVLLAVGTIIPTASAYTDISNNDYCYEAALRLGDLGIVSGYEDGSFHPSDTITRAEFACIIVSAMDKQKQAKSGSKNSAFADVPDGLWSAPYINYVAAQNIVAGYSDGNFQPDKTISFAESLTVLLRVLGYKEETVGYFWPNNYLDAAASLGISSDMAYGANQPITRGDAAIMIDRALFTDLSGEEDKTLLEQNGCTVLRDTIVLDSDTTGNTTEVRLSDAATYTAKMSTSVEVGRFADFAVIDKDGRLVALKNTESDETAEQKAIFVTGVTDSTINHISNGVAGSTRLEGDYTFYKNGVKTTFAAVKASIKAGTDITFYTKDDIRFAVIGDDDDVAPVIAKHNYSADDTNMEGTAIAHNGLTVYRGGKAASLSDIRTNDVVYYNTKTNVMDVYTDKVTGIYYDAQPSKTFVETVTIGGNSYTIGYDAAANALNANAGSFEIGERVTLLLGKDDKAVFAIELSEDTIENYGVVLATGTQIAQTGANEGSEEIYADVFMSNGTTARLVTNKDYKADIGYLVRISYENSKAKLVRQNQTTVGSGKLDRTNRTLNGKTLLKDVRIIQRNAYKTEEYAECELLDLDTMTAESIDANQLMNIVSANGFGDISLLYIKDVEATDDFGVISSVESNSQGEVTSYKIFTASGTASYPTTFTVSGLSAGDPVCFKTAGGSMDKLKKLYHIKTGTAVGAVDESRIMIGNDIYKLSKDVLVVKSDSTGRRVISIDELKTASFSNISLYSDTSAASAAVIRVIVIK